MSRTPATLIGAVVLSLVALTPVAGQDAEKHVFVTVLDGGGAPVDGLTAEHFAVREGGKDRVVTRVEPLRVPMHVAVLVDTSASNGSPDEILRTAVISFVERLASTNHVAVYSFGDRPVLVSGFTQDQAQLRAAMTNMFARGHTRSALADGIELALKDLANIETARPVIIAIAAETAEASGKSAGSVIKRLIAQSTAFHAVSLTAAATSAAKMGAMSPAGIAASSQALTGMIAAGEGDRERNQLLHQGTAATGGSRQRLTNVMALQPSLQKLANELANSYKVTFGRQGSDKIKDLQVGVMLEGVTLRATAAPFGTR